MRGSGAPGEPLTPVLEDWCGGDYDIYVPKRLAHRLR